MLASLALVGLLACGSRADDQEVALRIQALLEPDVATDSSLLRNFYRKRGYQPAWSVGGGMRRVASKFLDALDEAATHGLAREDYRVPSPHAMFEASSGALDAARREQLMADFDVTLSRAFLLYARHLAYGRVDPRSHSMGWHADDDRADLAAALSGALRHGEVRATLDDLAPTHPEYQRLRQALRAWRDNPGASADDDPRISLIRLNLERWRWLPPTFGPRYLVVNIPDFRLRVVEADREVLSMRVVVGKLATGTPVLTNTMTTLVLNPYWNVPESIVRGEILPALRADPSYLERHAMEFVQVASLDKVRIRQRPGAGNALGGYKFVFPNHLNIYLHHTPAAHLFARPQRGFSHGCVRIEEPGDLAAYLLRGEARWPAARIAEVLAAGKEVHIPLSRPLPVYIVYFTAWVDEQGRAQFRDDVYGYDASLARVLAARVGSAVRTTRPQPAGRIASARNVEAASHAGSG